MRFRGPQALNDSYKKGRGGQQHDSSFLHADRCRLSPMFKNDCLKLLSLASAFFLLSPIQLAAQDSATPTQLPNGRLLGQVPGNPREINNLPTAAAVSPDGRFVVFLHSGFGAYAEGNKQSL